MDKFLLFSIVNLILISLLITITIPLLTYFFKYRFSLFFFLKVKMFYALFLILSTIYLKNIYFVDNQIFIESLLILFSIYFFYSFVLFNLINSQIGALRVRILQELNNEKLTASQIKKKYLSKELLTVRIDRLKKGKQIKIIKNNIYIESKFILIVFYFFYYLKKIYYGKAY